jgi:hypothetical protein
MENAMLAAPAPEGEGGKTQSLPRRAVPIEGCSRPPQPVIHFPHGALPFGENPHVRRLRLQWLLEWRRPH